VVPLYKKEDVPFAVKSYFKNVGIPPVIICDYAMEQIAGKAKKLCDECDCDIRVLEKGTQWANRAERFVKIFKDGVLKDLKESNCPLVLWCYCLQRRSEINNATAADNLSLEGSNPHTKMTGQTCDISNLCQFGWYDWVYFRDEKASFPYPKEVLGRCLGPSKSFGNEMAQWVLVQSGKVICITTLRRLNKSEIDSEVEKAKREEFDREIKAKLGDSLTSQVMISNETSPEEPVDDPKIPEADEVGDINDYDEFLGAEVLLPQDGEHMRSATVVKRVLDENGRVKGTYSANPMLNTRIYEVMFPDGELKKYSANVIAENMFSQVDSEGYQYTLLDEIVAHRSTGEAVRKEDGWHVDRKGQRSRKLTTRGWYFNVQWKDGSQQWIPLKDLKESNPVDIAEYVQRHGLVDEPAFAWWVPHTLRKRERIIASVIARVKKKTHKYGIRVPRTVAEAYALDKENGNTMWRDAIRKEMKNTEVAFKFLDDGVRPPPGYECAPLHLIFDVKMDFTRKARLVFGGHKTIDPKGSTYAGVVSRESVRIAFTYAALMGLDVMAADIQNAYLSAPCSQKYYTICGPEFGSELQGRIAIIVRALYGGKSSGKDFRDHLRDCMVHLGYDSCLADPDVWMRKSQMDDGTEYWEYMLLYTDDCLSVSHLPRAALEDLGKYFTLKPGSIGPPKIYLGGKVSEMVLPNGEKAWAFSASQYVQEAVKNLEMQLEERGVKLTVKASAPIASGYRPELDVSPELDPDDASHYQSLIGILRWIVELGRIDICCEVSMLSSHLALPREGHLQQVYHIFAYLKQKHNARLVFDATYPIVDSSDFPKQDWSSFYGDVQEEVPNNVPEPLGYEFVMRAYVDADHAGDKLTRRSRTGFLVFLNMAPIYWLSKKQNGVETSSFGSEFVAMKQCCEYIRGLRYKLRMMGIPVKDPTFIYGDNKSVLCNASIPESTLKKKMLSTAFHFTREGAAKDEWRATYIKSEDNAADVLTKAQSGPIRIKKVQMFMWDI
jgi:hypothetical protein